MIVVASDKDIGYTEPPILQTMYYRTGEIMGRKGEEL